MSAMVRRMLIRNVPYQTDMAELRSALTDWLGHLGLGKQDFEITRSEATVSDSYVVLFQDPVCIDETTPLSIQIGNRLATLELSDNLVSCFNRENKFSKYTFDRKNSKINVFNQSFLARRGILNDRQNQVFFGPVPGHLRVNAVQTLLSELYWGSITRCMCPGVLNERPYNVLLTYATAFEAVMASVYLHCAKPFASGVTPHARLNRQLKAKMFGMCEDDWVQNKELGNHIQRKGYVNINDVPRKVLQLPSPPICTCSREMQIVGFDPDFRYWLGNCQHCNPQCDEITQFIGDNSTSPAQSPPQEKLNHVKEAYESAEEYIGIYKALLKADKNAERETFVNLFVRADVKKWAKVEETTEGKEKLFTCLMFCKTENDLQEYFLVGKKVRVESERSKKFGNKSLWKRCGEIVSVGQEDGIIRLIVRVSGLPSEDVCHHDVTLHPIFQKSNWTSMKRALKLLSKSKHAEYILNPKNTTEPGSPIDLPNFKLFGFNEPNPSQRDAITRAMISKFSAIIGPPGCGKTSVSALICLAAVMENRESTDRKGKKVLAAAPSNKAADEIFIKLMERTNSANINVVRMYSKSREKANAPANSNGLHCMVNEALKSNTTYNQIIPNRKKILYTALERQNIDAIYAEEEGMLLERADIIICTCQTAADGRLRDNKLKFYTLLIDEAAQSSEPQTLLPLLLASTDEVGRLVLVGDFQQLKATTKSLAAKEAGFERSLMERLHRTESSQILIHQYRLNSIQSAWTSKVFYGDVLGPGHQRRPDLLRNATFPVNWLSENKVVWITYQNANRESKIKTSYSNTFEGLIIQEILEIFKNVKMPKSKIDLLTFYEGQRTFLEDFLAPKFSLTPRNVDSMQGAENDIILISTTRSNPHGIIGFLSDHRRLNVATSRAKLGMLIVGNHNTIYESGNDYWKMLIDSVKLQKSMIFANVNDKTGKLIFEQCP